MVVIPCRSRYQAFIFKFISAHFGYGDQAFNIIDDPHKFNGSVAEKYFWTHDPSSLHLKMRPHVQHFIDEEGWEGGRGSKNPSLGNYLFWPQVNTGFFYPGFAAPGQVKVITLLLPHITEKSGTMAGSARNYTRSCTQRFRTMGFYASRAYENFPRNRYIKNS